MSTARHVPPALAWPLITFAALFLDAATWPPIHIRTTQPRPLQLFGIPKPHWADLFYRPLLSHCQFKLYDSDPNIFDRYYEWWLDRLAVRNTHGGVISWKIF
jgi:hypothetical protein